MTQYDEDYAAWKRSLPHAPHEVLHKKALAHAEWREKAATLAEQERIKAQTVKHEHVHRHRVPGVIIAAILLILGMLLVPKAHCQFSHFILQTQNQGSNVGFHPAFTKINCSTNMSCSDDGSTFTLTATSSAGTAWDSITNPTLGGLTLTQFANGNDFWIVKRKTDTSPTGSFFRFQTAAGADLCKLDITGTFSACSIPYSLLTGAPPTSTTVSGQTCTLGSTCTVTREIEDGLGDGLNAIAAGTYVVTNGYNDFGATYTITGIRCFTDNNGTSTLNAANDGATGLLTGAVTCTNAFAAGTQSGTTTIASGHWINFTFVADGTTKRATFEVTVTR